MGGTFYGYRERAVPLSRPPRLRPQGSVSPMKMSAALAEVVGTPGYDYFARSGDAPADFPSTWIELPWRCRMAGWTLRGGFLEVQISFDGEEVGDQRVIRASTTSVDSFVAYRVRRFFPTIPTWYQLLAII